ncbi:ALA-interacting subunit 3 [Striga asiatica]|uniref:ALA-interacting subunit 3 n=1 Tax=Striga asiatica TaxID=4170 RepID=A0A5A7R0I3_STRAF|nr:ALA-interacting subunit 3 [Striga asiatica]
MIGGLLNLNNAGTGPHCLRTLLLDLLTLLLLLLLRLLLRTTSGHLYRVLLLERQDAGPALPMDLSRQFVALLLPFLPVIDLSRPLVLPVVLRALHLRRPRVLLLLALLLPRQPAKPQLQLQSRDAVAERLQVQIAQSGPARDAASGGVKWGFVDLDQICDGTKFIEQGGRGWGEVKEAESAVELVLNNGERWEEMGSWRSENGGLVEVVRRRVANELESTESAHLFLSFFVFVFVFDSIKKSYPSDKNGDAFCCRFTVGYVRLWRWSPSIQDIPEAHMFTQQELPACKPILTPELVMVTFIFLGITFIPIGLSHLSASENVVELVDRYDEDCIPANDLTPQAAHNKRIGYIQDIRTDKTCTRTLTVPKKMKHPIYVYYQLDEFYQNHRRYVKSRNDAQYRNPSAAHRTGNCEPESVNDNREPIVPCGLIAWSLFNDTYSLSRNGAALPINKKGIAWESDKMHKFGSNVYPKNFQSRGLIGGARLNESIPLNQQEDLLVWMRTAALPTFRKLYGRIETDLEANEIIKVVIQNNYNTYAFNGKKKLVISTTTWIGGKNDFLGRVYITVGGPLGDPSYLSWNRNPPSN